MKTALITIKLDPKIKQEAKKVASDLGFNLSAVINGYLKNLIRTRTIYFEDKNEEPSDYLIDAFKEADSNLKTGLVSPSFDDSENAIAWLNNPDRKYARDL